MTKKFTYVEKQEGDALTAAEWNNLAQDVSAAVDSINNGNTNGGYGDVPSYITPLKEVGVTDKVTFEFSEQPSGAVGGSNIHGAAIELTDKGDKGVNVSLVGNNNINIEPREALGTGEGKNKVDDINRKGGNIALKPGDDIELWAHHRGSSKNDEVSVKVMTEVPKQSDPTKTDEIAAKLQLNTADIVLTSKDKQENSDEMNITVNKAANTRGYLKVRAQAIDLRCEDNGGIALQPKGNDGDGHENKIKFEHNGGDGKEFGTFNTEHTSIFTNDYRFNEAGTVYAVTRGALETTYKTSGIKKVDYPTLADDFKDIINESKSATWGNIVKTANAMNEAPGIHTKITSSDNLEIAASTVWKMEKIETPNDTTGVVGITNFPFEGFYSSSNLISDYGSDVANAMETNDEFIVSYSTLEMTMEGPNTVTWYYKLTKIAPNINLESENNIKIDAATIDFKKSSATAKDASNNAHTCTMAEIIQLVEWFKNAGNVSDMGTVNPFNVEPQHDTHK